MTAPWRWTASTSAGSTTSSAATRPKPASSSALSPTREKSWKKYCDIHLQMKIQITSPCQARSSHFLEISISTVKHISVECRYGDEIHRNPSKAKQKRIQYKSSRENVSDRGNAKLRNCKEFPKWRKKNPVSARAIHDMYCN